MKTTYAGAVSGPQNERSKISDRMKTNILKGPKAVVISHTGIGYHVDLLSGKTVWSGNIGRPTYHAFQSHAATNYIDLQEGIDIDTVPNLYHCQHPNLPKCLTIPRKRDGSDENIMRTQLGTKFVKPSVKRVKEVYHANTLVIDRVDWFISGKSSGGTWGLHFADVVVSDCNVYCAYTAERFIKIHIKNPLVELAPPNGDVLYLDGTLEGKDVFVYSDCNVYCAYTAERFIKIHIKNPLVELAPPNGDVLYLDGTLEGKEGKDVFVKIVPIKINCSKVIETYRACSHIANVLGLCLVEHDHLFRYMAFEQTAGCLGKYVGHELVFQPEHRQLRMQVLRNVVFGLLQLHKNGFIHGCVAPSSVLIRKGPGNGGMIKLCGLGKSVRIPKGQEANTNTLDYKAQKHQLARTILAFLTPDTHKYDYNYVYEATPEDWKIKRTKPEFYKDLEKSNYEVADLCEKLLDPNSSTTLLMAYNHISFWDADTKIDFISDVSDKLLTGELPGVQYLANSVFGIEWETQLDNANWLKVMEDASKHDKDAKDKAYNTKSLRDLLRLFRNSRNHPKEIEEARSPSLMERTIAKKFPRLMSLIYNHVLEHARQSDLYEKYHPALSELM